MERASHVYFLIFVLFSCLSIKVTSFPTFPIFPSAYSRFSKIASIRDLWPIKKIFAINNSNVFARTIVTSIRESQQNLTNRIASRLKPEKVKKASEPSRIGLKYLPTSVKWEGATLGSKYALQALVCIFTFFISSRLELIV